MGCDTLLFFSTLCDCVALVIVPRNLSLGKFGKVRFAVPGAGVLFCPTGCVAVSLFLQLTIY